MKAELVHTSLPRGLDGGTGFAVAARTGGMPRAMADALSALSGLPEAWPDATDWDRTLRATRAVAWQGSDRWVASVVRPCGMDHTGRGNRIAHHRLLEHDECARVCPVALLLDHERWMASWRGVPRELDPAEALPDMPGSHGPAEAWQRAFGDAGVAAAALEAAFRSGIGAWIVVPASIDRLPLLSELAGLISVENRWKRGWSTRALRLRADAAPMICVVDEREPALVAATGAPWAIHAATLRPVASEAMLRRAREGLVVKAPSRAPESASVAWTPPRRLAVPGPQHSTEPDAAPTPAPVPPDLHDTPEPTTPIVVEMERPARSAGARVVPWIVVAVVVAALAAWWMLGGTR